MKLVPVIQHLNLVCFGVILTATTPAKEPPPETTHYGLVRKHDSKLALAYVSPDAVFSQYKKVMILRDALNRAQGKIN